jgi:hypothetical protein
MLPWLRVDPAHDGPVVLVHLPGMASGLELWGLLFVPAVLGLGVLHGFGERLVSDLATLVVGGATLCLLGLYWQAQFQGYYVPDVGWYVALVGGLLLATVGVERVWSRFGHLVRSTDRRPA